MSFKEEFKKLVEIVRKNEKENGRPYRNEDIATTLGYKRTYFSELMGATGKVTADHIKALNLNYPYLSANPTSVGTSKSKPDDLSKLIDGTLILINTNADLKDMLKKERNKPTTEDEQKETFSTLYATVQGLSDLLEETLVRIGADPDRKAAANRIYKSISVHMRKIQPKGS